MLEAVILDQDGLMVDTEPLQSQAWVEMLQRYGKKPELHKNGLVHTVGISIRDNWKQLKEKYGISEDIEVLEQQRSKIYFRLLKQVKPMEGLLELLSILSKARTSGRIKLAIASSSNRNYIETVVASLGADFDVIVSGEDVKQGKPRPDIYLKAAEKLGVKPENCIVLEDSKNGVIAAYRANMKFIPVPSQYTIADFAGVGDELIIRSLMELNLERITAFWERPQPGYVKEWI